MYLNFLNRVKLYWIYENLERLGILEIYYKIIYSILGWYLTVIFYLHNVKILRYMNLN